MLSFLAVLEMQLTTPELIHAGERVRVLKFEIVPQRKSVQRSTFGMGFRELPHWSFGLKFEP